MAELTYTFGEYRLEPSERRLIGSAGAVPLPPKAFDLLVILASNPGRLLKKDDLMNRLWPGVFVEEVNLAQNVSALRRALGGDKKAFIETVAGVGYRFAVPVQIAGDGIDAQPGKRPPRLIVLPFRLLSADPDISFLSFSLADALTSSLGGLDTLVVRSSLAAAKFASAAPDLASIARDADVNLVVSGTIARLGNHLRITVQLSDAANGTLLWSHTENGTIARLFRLHDALVQRILGSLALPLATHETRRSQRDVPRSASAYEYYLRGNQASVETDAWPIARDLYLQSLDEDADFAPAWARLARVYRLIGKYRPEVRAPSFERCEQALRRALALNPDLSLAHSLCAQMDVDRGHAQAAMVRLLGRAARHPTDAETYSALVYACRFCGLFEASLAAERRVRHLDVTLRTSIMHTLFVMQRYDEVLACHGLIKGYVYVVSQFMCGRERQAIESAAAFVREGNRVAPLVEAARALFEGRRDDSLVVMDEQMKTMTDPEGLYYVSRHCAYLEDAPRALEALTRSIDGGYCCHPAFATDCWLDSIRDQPAFAALASRASERHQVAAKAFDDAGGLSVLRLGE